MRRRTVRSIGMCDGGTSLPSCDSLSRRRDPLTREASRKACPTARTHKPVEPAGCVR